MLKFLLCKICPVNEDDLNFFLELMSGEGLSPAVEKNLWGHRKNAAWVASSPFGKRYN